MRPFHLWRYEATRAGWPSLITPPLTGALILSLAALSSITGSSSTNVEQSLLAALEIGLPLAAGIGAATLVGFDSAVELQLTVPTRFGATLLRRLAISLAWVGISGIAMVSGLMVTGWWRTPHSFGTGQLIWLAPSLYLGTLGLLIALITRSGAAASGVIAGVWIVELVSGSALQEHGWTRLLLLFYTTRVGASGWLTNRLALIAQALLILVGAWALLQFPERLFTSEDT